MATLDDYLAPVNMRVTLHDLPVYVARRLRDQKILENEFKVRASIYYQQQMHEIDIN